MLKTPYRGSDPCWRNMPEVNKDVAGLREYVSLSNANANFFSYDTVAAEIFKYSNFFINFFKDFWSCVFKEKVKYCKHFFH